VQGFTLRKIKLTSENKLTIKPIPQIKKEAVILEKKQKTEQSNSEQKPITKTVVTNQQTPSTEKMSEAVPQGIPQLNKHKTEKTFSQELEIIRNQPKKKVTCSNCQKTFSTPLFTLDYSGSESKLVACCPYCNESIDNKNSNLANENSTVKKSYANEAYATALDFQIISEEMAEEIADKRYLK
jgi:hypothetical protein